MVDSKLKYGFTTGSCATVATKAALYMLLSGNRIDSMSIKTPEGIEYKTEIEDIEIGINEASCSVRKYSGDDPDVTKGIRIYSKVTISQGENISVNIDGGIGIGRVTKPGLDQPVSNAAINHVPRQMIKEAVLEVADYYDFTGTVEVLIYAPEGVEIAKKTMNEKLGIVGGISILGTSGIVWPMSNQAIIDTIMLETRQRKELGQRILAVSPGNYGMDYMKNTYNYNLEKSVKCSNFIGETIDIAANEGFEGLLITGHIGKLIKLAGGIMNTHSKEGDCRMEILSAAALREGIPAEGALRILDAVTTEDGISILSEYDLVVPTMKRIMDSIIFYVNKRADYRIKVEVIMYSNQYGELAKSDGSEEMLNYLVDRE